MSLPDPNRLWFRSLYWRIALGIIVLLIAVLVVEGVVFAWLVSRTPEALPPRVLQQSARAIAFELETSLAQDPSVDLERFVHDRVNALSRPITLVWRDGRVIYAGLDQPPQGLVQAARARLQRRGEGGPRRGSAGIDIRVRRDAAFAPVEIGGELSGFVIMLSGPPLRTVLRELGPVLLAVAAGLTVGGTAIAALMIFGPAHRRLRDLADAAHLLGAGDAGARAPETGGDEIARVARSFNVMAGDIMRRTEALQNADRARRQLLADVSHELMTPLTAMRGYLETLRLPDLPVDSAARDRYIGIVLEETLRLERLIGDLLDLARLEAGGPAFTIGTVRVEDLFDRVRSRHERPLEDKHVGLSVTIAPGAETIRGDSVRLEQALQNLAANALRHTPPGGRITLEARPLEDHRIAIAIRDTGPGIPSEHLPYLFDRFYKADASRTSAGGSGLGLSIVRAIVERHGGTVRVHSTPHVETVFEVILPATQEPAALRQA